MPDVFKDPDKFDPDRFGPGREEDKRDYAYIPFGGGRHKCMGNAFALLQVKAILAVLLRHYEFELAGDPIGSDFHGLVVGPTEPMRLRYKRRTRAVKAAVAEQITKAEPTVDDKLHLKVEVDRFLCQGHAVCTSEAPDVFIIHGGKVAARKKEVRGEVCKRVLLAEKHCPSNAIKTTDLTVS